MKKENIRNMFQPSFFLFFMLWAYCFGFFFHVLIILRGKFTFFIPELSPAIRNNMQRRSQLSIKPQNFWTLLSDFSVFLQWDIQWRDTRVCKVECALLLVFHERGKRR